MVSVHTLARRTLYTGRLQSQRTISRIVRELRFSSVCVTRIRVNFTALSLYAVTQPLLLQIGRVSVAAQHGCARYRKLI